MDFEPLTSKNESVISGMDELVPMPGKESLTQIARKRRCSGAGCEALHAAYAVAHCRSQNGSKIHGFGVGILARDEQL